MKLRSAKVVLATHPFKVEELDLERGGKPLTKPFYRLLSQDWVNVLPVTTAGQAVLIRQPRAGVLKTILETPGGVIEPGETDPTLTAARELEEETGYVSQRFLALGSSYANPAIQNNRCHFFLALNCQLAPQRQHFPDADEDITVELVPVADLEHLVRTAQVDHALSALCILLAAKYLRT